VYRVNTDYRKQKQGIFSRRYWTETDSEDVRIDNCGLQSQHGHHRLRERG
jgi:hypothetical protein